MGMFSSSDKNCLVADFYLTLKSSIFYTQPFYPVLLYRELVGAIRIDKWPHIVKEFFRMSYDLQFIFSRSRIYSFRITKLSSFFNCNCKKASQSLRKTAFPFTKRALRARVRIKKAFQCFLREHAIAHSIITRLQRKRSCKEKKWMSQYQKVLLETRMRHQERVDVQELKLL